MTPKSLLRHPMAKSGADEFVATSHFKRILSDRKDIADDKVRRLVLCSGKVAYDLMETREKERLEDVSIVRLEQLYPFPGEPLAQRLARMSNLEEVVWCQEEPKNNGAWFFVESQIEAALTEAGHTSGSGAMRASYAGRDASASPATGLASRHKEQQEALVAAALGIGG
jgi:2-oxoglutarate dehydrogenase E1 component